MRSGREVAGKLQHLGKRARFAGQLPDRQAAGRQGSHQYVQDLQPAAGLPVRHEDVHGTKERAIRHLGL